MGHRDEVEFLIDDGRPVPCDDEDVVDFTPERMPRWVIGVGVVVLAALVAVLVTRPQHKSATGAVPVAASSANSAQPTSGLGTPIPIGATELSVDVATSGPMFFLQPGHLYRVSGVVTSAVTLDGAAFAKLGTSARLFRDPAANRIWAVALDIPGGEIIEFDSRDLRRLRTMPSVEAIRDAAALSGHLYLAVPSGLADVAPGAAAPTLVPGTGGYLASLAADPKRARLLMLVLSAGASIRQLTIAAGVGRTRVAVPVGGGAVRVTRDGTIWVAGFGNATAGAVLVRLDQRTLRPVGGSPLVSELGAGGWIESAGDRDIWIRGGRDGEGLWCIDGRDGRVLQHWPRVTGTVTSGKGEAFASADGALVPLVLDRCGG
ncbi:MAG: hypothetical protein ABR604_05400 [Jatrophihabitantaceae bacterium]